MYDFQKEEAFFIFKEGAEVARAKLYLKDEDWVTLEEVVVASNRRGEGFGREVCQKALAWCKSHNVNVLVTACPISQNSLDEHQLKDFYESLGFKLLHAGPGRYYLELINNPLKARPLSELGFNYV